MAFQANAGHEQGDTLQICLLGQGTFGIVVKAMDLRTDPSLEVAIKLLPRGDIVSLYLKKELQWVMTAKCFCCQVIFDIKLY